MEDTDLGGDDDSILDQQMKKQQAQSTVQTGKSGKGGKGGGSPAAAPSAPAKAAVPATSSKTAKSYNWWEIPDLNEKKAEPKDDTPFEIRSNPKYKELTGRFLGGLFKDKNLELHNLGAAKEAIDHDEITGEKEREGYYPNELD